MTDVFTASKEHLALSIRVKSASRFAQLPITLCNILETSPLYCAPVEHLN